MGLYNVSRYVLYKQVIVSRELTVSIFMARILRQDFKDPNSTLLYVYMISIVLLLLLFQLSSITEYI